MCDSVLSFFVPKTLIVHSVCTIRWFAILDGDIAAEVPPSSFHIEDRFESTQDADDRVYSDLDSTVGAEVGEFECRIRRILWWFSWRV